MAKLETILEGDYRRELDRITRGVLNASTSATLEECSDFREGDAQCSVRVFERYSYAGGNRVSMTVTFFQNGNGPIHLSAITAGGSQALFWKVNTIGEEAFLDTLSDIL